MARHRQPTTALPAPDNEEKYRVFDALADLALDGVISYETAFELYRELRPSGIQDTLPFDDERWTAHDHEYDANVGEVWCRQCNRAAASCEQIAEKPEP
ncbi:hypothetical protein [Georgenia thermotolerans]|uniref:Uncharacterized protein n=1 Tax=Georgenia thermotolerans TaxID=527326 RepID=A0A7J5UP47_9MICO|nr:hypothetical protein [Georgenia thermotolerans]KAE8764186.1 hypothetical protein GB883_10425 [Georgenia thermotolerans]